MSENNGSAHLSTSSTSVELAEMETLSGEGSFALSSLLVCRSIERLE